MKLQLSLPAALRSALDAATTDWHSNGKLARFWQKDPTLWTNDDEAKWLGWINIVERQQGNLPAFAELAIDVRDMGYESLLLLGMGGSSLCPEVLALTFGQQPNFPALHIVDSTNPAQVLATRRKLNLEKTLVIVASKSGSTLEPNVLKQYFFEEMRAVVGSETVGSHFIAITDPGSKMEQVARADKFRYIFYGDPEIGGRYSALSNFGLIPATAAGLNIARLLDTASAAVNAAKAAPAENSALQIGLLMGLCANQGRDKITIFTSPEISDLGAWMEQLIAESTGKLGKGITPVDREAISDPADYSADRLFAYIRLTNSSDHSLDAKVASIAAAGHPVITIDLDDRYGIFGQFFTWEVATAIAGSIMAINPFNQPDVESAKIETRALTTAYEQTGQLPTRTPFFTGDGISLYATDEYAIRLTAVADGERSLPAFLHAHLDQITIGDYFATLAYLPMFPEHEAALQTLRHRVLDAKHVATCLGFGPRFLHSTGQDYKGGPNTGVFLQITSDHSEDLAIPAAKYTFGIVIDAQAAGDIAVLEARGRRALRVHLGTDIAAGLATLNAAIAAAL
jgi:glucose-6-phosphate isomerase